MAQYGSTADVIDRESSATSRAGTRPETRPQGVVQAFVCLIETPEGKRPFRTAPTAAIEPVLEPYNALAESVTDTIVQMCKATEFTALRQPLQPL